MSQPESKNFSQLPFGPKTSLLGAAALVLYGLSRRSKPGAVIAAAGGLWLFKAAKSQPTSTQSTKESFLVNASPEAAYGLWRDFENLPRFMVHLKSVRILDSGRSEWVASGPMDKEIRWTAEIVDDLSNQRIAWKSMAGSDIETSGSVEFRPDPLHRGTYVTADISYRSPGGAAGRALAALTGKHPEFMVHEDVRRFKSLLETGEVPTVKGQSHGPRGIHGSASRVLFRETTNQADPQAAFAKSA